MLKLMLANQQRLRTSQRSENKARASKDLLKRNYVDFLCCQAVSSALPAGDGVFLVKKTEHNVMLRFIIYSSVFKPQVGYSICLGFVH